MLYKILKFPARIAFLFYCRHLSLSKPAYLQASGPMLIAANHPNSFLDAIVIATLFKQPVYSLVRGDVYSNPFFSKLLYSLNMLPVYRVSEGVENLDENYVTFKKCKDIFRNNGIVLIFSEGRCINEWKLRPLKKGTARLAISSWNDGIPLKVLPAGINYSNFRKFGKNIQINFADAFDNLPGTYDSDGKAIQAFNTALKNTLKELVVEADPPDEHKIQKLFHQPTRVFKKLLLMIPAAIGWALHAPLYLPAKKLVIKKWNNDHFDSLVIAILFISYPVYLLLLLTIVLLITKSLWAMSVLLILPFCAWSLLQLKTPQ